MDTARRRPTIGLVAGEGIDAWSASGIGHHWALGTGHRITGLRAVAGLLDLPLIEVN